MIKVYIRYIHINAVTDVGSVNIGSTLNLVSRGKKKQEEGMPPPEEASPPVAPLIPPVPPVAPSIPPTPSGPVTRSSSLSHRLFHPFLTIYTNDPTFSPYKVPPF